MSQKQTTLRAVTEAFADVLGPEEAERCVHLALKNSASPTEIIQSLRDGVEVVGQKYHAQEYFLSELIMAGLMCEQAVAILRPALASSSTSMVGRVVIGTVRGDIHDIGKKLVSTMLMSAGFDMVDIGVDVGPDEFVEAARKHSPMILAMSCLLTNAMDEMSLVSKTLEKAGLRTSLKVLVGGRPINENFAKEIGADGYGADAVEAVKSAKSLLS